MALIQKFIQNNFTSGRNGQRVEIIVIHTYNGAGRSLYNWFNNVKAGVSAHYAVFLDGEVEQYVRDEDTSWNAGNNWANTRGIGIEHQDNGNPADSVRTNEQYEASSQLIASLYRKHNLNIDDKGLITEHRSHTSTGCPGGLDTQRIRNRVYEILHPVPPIDDFYRVFVDGSQISANKDIQNVVSYYYYNSSKNIKVTYKNNDITSQIKSMASDVQKEIEMLKQENTTLTNHINVLNKELEDLSKLYSELLERHNDSLNTITELQEKMVDLRDDIKTKDTKIVNQTIELAKLNSFKTSIWYAIFNLLNPKK